MATCQRHKTVLYLLAPAIDTLVVGEETLAEALGDLRYDALAEYLAALSEKLRRDSVSDGARGRGMLATCLGRAASAVSLAAHDIEAAWKICEPKMRSEKKEKCAQLGCEEERVSPYSSYCGEHGAHP